MPRSSSSTPASPIDPSPVIRLLRHLWQPILRPVSLFLAQGQETADRLRAIGIPPQKIRNTGNLKYDLKAAPQGPVFAALAAALPADSPCLIAGSTLEGEEALLLAAWPEVLRAHPSAILLLAPRHTSRFAAVITLAEAQGGSVHRAASLSRSLPIRPGDLVVLDTIGDLAGLYALATAAFLGGSLVPAGGHNPLEPARFGVPVLMGPSFENFREIVAMMQASNAVEIIEPPTRLSDALAHMLSSDPDVRALGERGRSVVLAQTGATARCLEALAPFLATAEFPR